MPEIAEVETVRKTLQSQIVGKKIQKVTVLYESIIEGNSKEFCELLAGETIQEMKRIGKWLLFELDHYFLLSHLRMEGKYFLKSAADPILKHEHIIFTFQDKSDIRYHDTRKFGRMILTVKEDLYKIKAIQKQGVEPNQKEFTTEYLKAKIAKKNLPIKTILLDQTIISGLGNIYANEVLFASKINPFRKGKELNAKDYKNIIESTNQIITKAIQKGGTTIKSYTSSLGVTGRFQNDLMVHKREKEPCKICQTLIKNEKIGGRSTYYCPNCQK